jgi:hypothetical protein
MLYRLLADLVVLIHFLFILLVLFGGLLVLRNRRLVWLHLPALAWGAGIELAGGICPLTPLELWLRHMGAEEGYAGGFIENYLIPVIYPQELTRAVQIGLGLTALALNLAIYLWLWRRLRREESKKADS